MSAQLSSLQNSPVDKSVKNIEIYATLPKNKKGLLSRSSNKTKQVIEDEEYMMYERPGRSLQTKSKSNKKEGEKRARSEERGTKNTKEFVSNSLTKETKKPKVEEKENKQGKKQHKIRRKLLMGGLIKRKNRSMPDLREDELQLKDPPKEKIVSKDDSMVDSVSSQSSLSGYLSEGHLESTGNPNLLRSKLMRKSFYTNKFLHFAKVPPPPPMRTSSQLSKAENNKQQDEWCSEPQSLPYIHSRKEDVTYANGGMLLDKDNKNVMTTQAQVHHNPEQNVVVNNVDDLGFPLPPYPSPLNSVCHSRQPSEEFPPPPPPAPAPAVDEVDGICPLMPVEQMKLVGNEEEKWGNELQSKQSAWCSNDYIGQDLDSKSIVKDLKNKFEQKSIIDNLITHAINNLPADGICETPIDEEDKKFEKELKGALSKNSFENCESKRKSGKKKNVTFCEQVVLVATAEEDEVDSYIPNPILERVLRSVLHKDTPIEQNREVTKSVIPLKRNDSGQFNRSNLSLKSYENNNTEEKSITEVKDELPPKSYRMSPVQQSSQTLSPMVQPKLKAPLPEQIQKPVESVKNYRMSPIQQSAPLNQSPMTQQKFKSPSTSLIANTMSNLSINSLDSIQSVPNQSPTAHRFYSNNQQTNIYPQQYQSLSPMGHQKQFLNNEPHSLNYQPLNENKSNCLPVNSRSNQSSLERNQTTRQVNGVPPNCYPQQSPVDGRSGHFRYNGDNQTQLRLHGNQMSNSETNTHQYQTNPGSPRTLNSQNNLRYNVSNTESSGQHSLENRSYNHGQTPQYQCQPHERLNNNNPSHLIDNRTCYPRQPSPVQAQHNNNNVQHQMNSIVGGDSRSSYIQTQQQFDRLNTTHLNNDKTGFVQQGSPTNHHHNVSQYNTNCENNKTGYLQQGLSPNHAQQLERMAQHYENKTGGYIQQGLPINQPQQFTNAPFNNNNITGDNKTNNSPQCSPNYTQIESRTSFPTQCSPVPPNSPHQVDNRPPGYPRNNVDVKMSPSPQHSPGMLQRQRSMVNGFHSMPYSRTDNVAHLPPAHPKKDLQPNFPRSQGETHSSSSLDRKQLQQQYSNQQDGNNPTLPSKNRPVNSVQRTNTVRRPMTVYEPQQLPPYQHPPAPVVFKQQQQSRPNGQPRATTPNGTTVPANDPSRYTVYQQPPSPRLQDKCNMSRPSPCNLCRKKAVNHPSIYCSDCDFYMSRFKPKAQTTTC